jgi:hypothetical protein
MANHTSAKAGCVGQLSCSASCTHDSAGASFVGSRERRDDVDVEI